MQHQIEFGPAFAWLKVQLAPNEMIQAEAGAMVRGHQRCEGRHRLELERHGRPGEEEDGKDDPAVVHRWRSSGR